MARVGPDSITRAGSGGVQPGGLAFDLEGTIIVADYGLGEGLKRTTTDGAVVETLVQEAEGRKVGRANYPAIDREGRVWCTNSTSERDDRAALKKKVADGFVFVVDSSGPRIVSEGLPFPNGLAFSADFKWLYVAVSSGPGVLRAEVDGAELGPMEQFGPNLRGTTDGLAFDEAGNLWVTMVVDPKALVVIDPSGHATTVIEDPTADLLGDPTSIAFGGDDMRNLYVTSPALDHLTVFRTEIPGAILPGVAPRGF